MRLATLLVSILCLGSLFAGCGDDTTQREPGYRDLLSSIEVKDGRLDPPIQAKCGEETHWARPLFPDTELRTKLTLEANATVVASLCTDLPGVRANGDQLTVTVEAENKRSTERLWLRPESSGRWSDTSGPISTTGPVTLVVKAELPTGPVYLRDLAILHEVAAPPPPPAAAADPPPTRMLLISLDTFRHDAFEGWPTPTLDRLTSESETFAHSWATSGWTKPSHGSMWTGHVPLVHGTVDFHSVINPELPTVAERLADAGFATAALIDFLYLDERFGFARGFDTFHSEERNLEQQNRWMIEWIREHRDQPFFAVLHTYETHSDAYLLPYESPDMRTKRVDQRFGTENYGCLDALCATARLVAIRDDELDPLANEAEILRFLYGHSVTYLDQRLGMFFDDLRTMGLWDDMLVIVTSDHGEAFLENGHVTHGLFWETVLRVPLWVKWPAGRKAGVRTELPVSGIDLMPTILALAGLEHDDLPGADLATLRRERPIFAGSYGQVVIDDGWKVIDDPGTDMLGLFDLSNDPGELRNLVNARPEKLERLQTLRREHVRRERARAAALANPSPESPLDEDERARLEALGYVD
ncbi:MAG: sulfatase [Acidobacteriota bacterium]